MAILRTYAHLFGRYRWQYALGLAALVATNALYMAVPRLLGAAIDAMRAGADAASAWRYAGAIVLLATLQAATRVGSRVWVLGVSRRVEYDLKGMLYERLVRLAPSFYHAISTGDLMSRMTHDVTLVRALGGPGVLYFANALLVYVMGVAFMASLSWQLTLVVLAPLPLMAWIVRGMVHRVRAYALASRQALSALNTVVQENLAGAQVVRAFALEQAQVGKFTHRSSDYMDWALKESWTRAQMIPLVGLAGGLAYLGVLGFGGGLAAAGRVSLGELVAFVSYIAMMVFPTVAFGWILSLLQRGAAAMERLDEVLTAPVTIADPADAVALERPRGGIVVRALSFRYADALASYGGLPQAFEAASARRPALVGVSFEVEPGQFVALVGRVGAGKTTLLKALVRLLEVPEGSVFLDGVDLTRIRLADLRAAIAYVPQDDFLFAGTVRDNIAFGNASAGEEAIVEAARTAGLELDDPRLPGGLDTQVGERGLNLSGGQRQRVALARALVRPAVVLLLDNALSNVDTETERRILGRLARSRRGRSLLVSSNRITAVQEADRILVMDRGRIVDAGDHARLVARAGLYRTMYEQQRLSAQLEEY